MRRRHEVMRARKVLVDTVSKHKRLSDAQLTLFQGMISALLWVCGDETNENVLKRLLDGEQVSEMPSEFAQFALRRGRERIDDINEAR